MKCPLCKKNSFHKLDALHECKSGCKYYYHKFARNTVEFLIIDYNSDNYLQIMNFYFNSGTCKTILSRIDKITMNLESMPQCEINNQTIDLSIDKDFLIKKIKKYLIYA